MVSASKNSVTSAPSPGSPSWEELRKLKKNKNRNERKRLRRQEGSRYSFCFFIWGSRVGTQISLEEWRRMLKGSYFETCDERIVSSICCIARQPS